MNGADVGTIRDGVFPTTALGRMLSGSPGGRKPGASIPGGAVGGADGNSYPKGSRGRNSLSSVVLSATSASTLDEASSSSPGISWSSRKE